VSNGDGSFSSKPVTGVSLLRTISTKKPTCIQYNASGGCTETGGPGDGYGWSEGDTFYILDANGDGKLDIITAALPQLSPTASPTDPCGAGVVCTHLYSGDGKGGFTEQPTSLAGQDVYSQPDPGYVIGSPLHVGDFDGDGYQGLMNVGNPWLHSLAFWHSQGNGNFTYAHGSGNCLNPIDFNGDGVMDCLYPSSTASLNELLVGTTAGSFQTATNFNLTSTGMEMAGTAGIRVADFNGDGKQDILRWEDYSKGTPSGVLYLSNGDGTFTQSTTFTVANYSSFANIALQSTDGTDAFVVGDFTGRGNAEILRLQSSYGATSNILFIKQDSTPADLLSKVTSPTGAVTTLAHVPLSNADVTGDPLGARYIEDQDFANASANWMANLILPTYVVSTVQSDSGVVATTIKTDYVYKGLKADRRGRGLLGFREILRQQPGADGSLLTTDTQYLQAQPYIGLPSSVAVYQGGIAQVSGSSVPLSLTTNVYCDQATGGSATANGPSCPSTAKIQRPYQQYTTSSGSDLKGIALPQTTVKTSVNATGDPTDVLATTTGTGAGISQTFVRETKNAFYVDDTSCAADNLTCKWFIGRVSQTTVNGQVPNNLASIATSAGTNPLATATAGNGPVQAGVLDNLIFPMANLGVSETLQTTLANDGATALSVTVPSASSVSGRDFSFVSTDCPTSLAPESACHVTIRFTPTAPVNRSGTLTIDTGAGSLVAALSGSGYGSLATLTSTSNLTVPPTWYGAAAQTVTASYRNDGTVPMTLSAPSLSAPLSATTNCTSVKPNSSCSVTITAATNVPGLSQSQTFAPTGATQGPAATTVTWSTYTAVPRWSSTSLNFGGVTVNHSSSQAATLYNDGNVAYNWAANNAISNLPTGFSVNTSGCASVAPGGSCKVTVTFAPTTAASYSGSGLTMSAASYNTNTFSVQGTGWTPTSISASTPSISATTVSPTPASGSVTLTNNGQTPTTLTLSVTGGARVSPTTLSCPTSGSCGTVTVTSPSAMGTYNGTLSVSSSAGGTVPSVSLQLQVTGSIATLTTSTAQTIQTTAQGNVAPLAEWVFRNDGNAAMSLTMGPLSPTFSVYKNECSSVLPTNLCAIYVNMSTAQVGTFGQSGISVSGATQGNRADLSVKGTVAPNSTTLTLSSSSISFGTVTRSLTSDRTLTITNTGSASTTISGLGVTYTSGTARIGGFWPSGCSAALAPNQSCTVDVEYAAGCTGGSRSGTLTISGTNNSPKSVTLTATTSSSGGSCM
jgi:hypothetical protein